MSSVDLTIHEIEEAAARAGLAEFAREADVPYTTALDWRARGWRPKWVTTLAKFAAAAERLRDRGAST